MRRQIKQSRFTPTAVFEFAAIKLFTTLSVSLGCLLPLR